VTRGFVPYQGAYGVTKEKVFAGLRPYAIIKALFWISPILLLSLGGIEEHIRKLSESKVGEMTETTSSDHSAHSLLVCLRLCLDIPSPGTSNHQFSLFPLSGRVLWCV